jgi:FKBP-type peptidyl-prolyl cis-trans isomerase 2
MKRAIYLLSAFSLLLLLSGCGKPTVSAKKMVSLNYTGTLADGTQFDTSVGRDPLEFLVGTGSMIPGFEKAVMGLKAGDKKKFEIKAAEAYGEYDKTAVQEVPKESFPKDMKLEKGTQLGVQTQSGTMPVVIAEVREKTVMVDFNHPLAGKDLTFEIEIMKIRDATKEELAATAPSSTTPAQTQKK